MFLDLYKVQEVCFIRIKLDIHWTVEHHGGHSSILPPRPLATDSSGHRPSRNVNGTDSMIACVCYV